MRKCNLPADSLLSNIELYISEVCKERARAAEILENPLSINGIEITAGSSHEGIKVESGIEKLYKICHADRRGELEAEETIESEWIKIRKSFWLLGTVFYEESYKRYKKGETNDKTAE